jgi:hypothetical protein
MMMMMMICYCTFYPLCYCSMEFSGGAVMFRQYGSERKLYKLIYMLTVAVEMSVIQ